MKVFEVLVERKEAPVGSTADLGVWHGGLGALLGDVVKKADGWFFADGTKIKDPQRIAQAEKMHIPPATSAPQTSPRPKAKPTTTSKTAPSTSIRPKERPEQDTNTKIYTVVAGDTVYAIARRLGIPASDLYALNDFDNDTKLSIGQKIEIPGDDDDAQTKKEKKPEQPSGKYDLSKFSETEKHLINGGLGIGMQREELASFLAQCSIESDNFSGLEEYGDPAYIKKYEPVFSTVNGKRVQTNQRAMDVGNTQPGDGEKFKGRGYIQVTGRENYARVAKATGLPLIEQPELLATPSAALTSALAFWKFRVRRLAKNNWEDQLRITRFVTGTKSAKLRAGDKRYPERLKNYKKYKAMLATAGVPSSIPKEKKK